jgi:hypothetical protein
MSDVAVRRLGYAGLFPFVACAALAHVSDPLGASALRALAGYGAVIVSFLGGVHWGFGFQRRGAAWVLFGWGVVPSLLAWVALLLPLGPGLWMLAATLVLAYQVDRQVYPRFGAGSWLGLRLHLTSVAAVCCAAGALAA